MSAEEFVGASARMAGYGDRGLEGLLGGDKICALGLSRISPRSRYRKEFEMRSPVSCEIAKPSSM